MKTFRLKLSFSGRLEIRLVRGFDIDHAMRIVRNLATEPVVLLDSRVV